MVNNFVDLQSDGVQHAMEISFSDYLLVAYNTVRITADQSVNHRLLFVHDLGGPVRVLNNVFDNRSWGYVITSEDPSNFLVADHNCWYSQNAAPFYRNGQNFSSLADYRLTGQDGQSVFQAPFFPNAGDYHTADAVLNGQAQPLAEVPTDLEGEKRHPSSPDIGADESVWVHVAAVAATTISISPTLVQTSVEVHSFGADLQSVQVYDLQGRAVCNQGPRLRTQCRIDATSWPPGVYVVRVQTTDGGVVSGKLLRMNRP